MIARQGDGGQQWRWLLTGLSAGKKALHPWDREPWRTELGLSQRPEGGCERGDGRRGAEPRRPAGLRGTAHARGRGSAEDPAEAPRQSQLRGTAPTRVTGSLSKKYKERQLPEKAPAPGFLPSPTLRSQNGGKKGGGWGQLERGTRRMKGRGWSSSHCCSLRARPGGAFGRDKVVPSRAADGLPFKLDSVFK